MQGRRQVRLVLLVLAVCLALGITVQAHVHYGERDNDNTDAAQDEVVLLRHAPVHLHEMSAIRAESEPRDGEEEAEAEEGTQLQEEEARLYEGDSELPDHDYVSDVEDLEVYTSEDPDGTWVEQQTEETEVDQVAEVEADAEGDGEVPPADVLEVPVVMDSGAFHHVPLSESSAGVGDAEMTADATLEVDDAKLDALRTSVGLGATPRMHSLHMDEQGRVIGFGPAAPMDDTLDQTEREHFRRFLRRYGSDALRIVDSGTRDAEAGGARTLLLSNTGDDPQASHRAPDAPQHTAAADRPLQLGWRAGEDLFEESLRRFHGLRNWQFVLAVWLSVGVMAGVMHCVGRLRSLAARGRQAKTGTQAPERGATRTKPSPAVQGAATDAEVGPDASAAAAAVAEAAGKPGSRAKRTVSAAG